MKTNIPKRFSKILSSATILSVALFVAISSILPLLAGHASALQLSSRSLTMSSGVPSASGASNTYTFGFTIGATSTGTLQSLKFVACTAATATYGLGSTNSTAGCTAPTGMTFNSTTAVFSTQSGFQGATNFASDAAGAGNCTPAANVICAKRTDATTQTGSTAKTIKFTTITNPSLAGGTCSTNGCSFYIGIYTYSDAGYATNVDSGTVAGAVVSSLTVTAQVAEILVFCVGSTSVDDATTAVGNASSCSGSTVDLGTLDPTAINFSKTNGNNLNGVAILRTNAINGSAVYYDAIQDLTGTLHQGALRIVGANCTTVPGSCITSQGTTQGTFTAGTQKFGMTVAGTNCGTETAGGYYTCTYTGSGDQNHLVPQSPYMGRGSGATGQYCTTTCNTDNGFAWDETGTAGKLAQASSNNVVADEALILKFAATPSITNTFGSYQVKADFTAVATY